jgi:hypothetical protein
MWNRKSILFLCILVWFVSPPTALCQNAKNALINPVEIHISPDSTGVRVTSIPLSPQPVKRRLPDTVSMQITSDGEPLTATFLNPGLPTRCWVRYSFSGTCWNWRIRKPGNYAGKILTCSINSNVCVLIDFRQFDRLRRTDGSNEYLDAYYALSDPNTNIQNLNWISPSVLNGHDLNIPQSPNQPYWWALWQEIGVIDQTTSADYKDNAVIAIKLNNQGVWLDASEIQNPLSDK